MKRLLFIGLIVTLLLLPTAPAFAQSDGFTPPQCDPQAFLNEIAFRVQTIQTADDVANIVMYGVETVSLCLDSWLTLLMGSLMGIVPPDMMPPMMDEMGTAAVPATVRDPNDGILTVDEAEYALEAAFSGDFDTINDYLCPAEQITPEDIANFPANITVESLKCASVEDTMTCAYTLTADGETLSEEVTFTVEDGKLCDQTTN